VFYPKTDYVDLEMIYINSHHSLPSFKGKMQTFKQHMATYVFTSIFPEQFAQNS